MAATTSIHGMWSTRLAFILAASGSAVGLGNIWRFPYTAGEYGGGAFVLVYLLCVAGIGIPIMMAEILLGRRGRQSPINTMRTLAGREGKPAAWSLLGWMGIVAGFLILSFYSVIAGWTLAYAVRAAGGAFSGIDGAGSKAMFDGFIGNPEALLAWHTLFMVLTVMVVARGVASGLEQSVKWMMPALFVLLLVMVVYAGWSGDLGTAARYLFAPDFGRLQDKAGEAILSAMGQAFFSLSLGMGAIMVYGSYLRHDASIARSTLMIAATDTLVALLAGLAIFPMVFAHGLEPGSGPGLIFVTLPIAFGEIPGGSIFGALFFALLIMAAWTSSISILEPVVAWLVENRGLSRVRAAILGGTGAWLLGIACLLSLNLWSGYTVAGKGVLDLFDYVTANLLLPLGGILIAVFAGWVLPRAVTLDELGGRDGIGYRLWRFLIRYVAPAAVALVLLNGMGLFKAVGLA
jgi:neurotransmitter:Na+ symporter, NSS family